MQSQLPELPISKHHQIMTVALEQAWPDDEAESVAATAAQQFGGAALRRHSFMPAAPTQGRSDLARLRRATADLGVDCRQRQGSAEPLPTSFTAHQATAMKQKFEQMLESSRND